ncbi:MAG: transketolase [Burkholderiaceae bacterium]
MNLPLTDALRTRARRRLLQMHYASGVGHIGGNLSALDAMLLVFHEFLREQDRFILSKGHSAGALYIALWSVGRLADEALETFHKDGTLLAGHPPSVGIPDIPFATGSLGHGLSLAAGTALGHRLQGSDARVVCLTSDGEWQEGSTWEALIFACHQRLGNLTVLVDHNELQGFGSTREVASMAPLWDKLVGFDAAIDVVDGHDLDALRDLMRRPAETRPRIVVMRTVKGKGVSFMENRMEWHYLPLGTAQYEAAMAEVDEP